MAENEFRWEEPPNPRRMRNDWDGIVQKLKKNPGKWAMVTKHEVGLRARTLRTLVTQVKNGRIQAFRPAGAFEAVSRIRGKEVAVYVRYVGEKT